METILISKKINRLQKNVTFWSFIYLLLEGDNMSRGIDITNITFGDLTAIERVGSSTDKQALWLCQCSCGNTRVVKCKQLRSGQITHCGCKNKTTAIDLTGKRFGRLTVLERNGKDKANKAIWLCQCDCGNIISIRGTDLRNNKIISCGCNKREKLSKDLIGQRFGHLIVINKSGTNIHGNIWLCKCDCGNEIEVTTNHLTTGNTQSCGCLSSKGENQIAFWLKEHNINFKQQYTFKDLLGKNKNPLRFDIAILEQNKLICLIEYQGIQHYQNVYNLSKEDWQYSLLRDDMKRIYCSNNKIPLYEIKYNENINKRLEDIINEINFSC